MDAAKTIELLREYHALHADDLGIVEIGIFGSLARGSDTPDSDIDVVVTLEHPDYLALARIKRELEALLGRPVDLVRKRPGMNPILLDCIKRDAVYA